MIIHLSQCVQSGTQYHIVEGRREYSEVWIKDMVDKHIPTTKEELLDSVQRIVCDRNRATPFTNNRPDKKWYSAICINETTPYNF